MSKHDGEITTPIPIKRRTSVADRVRVRRGVDAATATADSAPHRRIQSQLEGQLPATRMQVKTSVRVGGRRGIRRGTIVAGTYRVVDRIARGGTAIVYRAWHITMAREVALKVLTPPGSGRDAIFEARFIREARTLAGLAHPNIIEVIDFGRMEDGRCYLAMEFVDGPRLSDLFRDPAVDAAQRIDALIQVTRGIDHAHSRGVIHRDIKLSNAMVVQRGNKSVVKVLDFGLAKLLEDDQDITQAGVTMGSPHFMSPEQARGQDLDERTDIYSIGILAWVAFTGRYPFSGSNATATMVQHCVEPVPWLSRTPTLFPVPDGLCSTVRSCMAKDRDHRFPSALSLLQAFQEAYARALPAPLTTPDADIVLPVSSCPPPTGDIALHGLLPAANTQPVGLAIAVAQRYSGTSGTSGGAMHSVRRLALLGCLLVSSACLWWQDQGLVPPPWTVASLEHRRH